MQYYALLHLCIDPYIDTAVAARVQVRLLSFVGLAPFRPILKMLHNIKEECSMRAAGNAGIHGGL